MIDLIKFEVLNKSVFEFNLETNPDIKLESRYDFKTGKPLAYPKRSELENFNISITDNKATINGSIHKFHNRIKKSGNQNYNDFSYCDFRSSINSLCTQLLINPLDTKITNLEFGFNLEVDQDPKQIIDSNLLMYDFKDDNRNQKYGGKGDFKEFEMSDYSIKVYNKSKQYKLTGKNILRIELKITKSRYLENLGIFNLEDLNEKGLELLQMHFLKHFSKLLIMDTKNSCNRPRLDDEVYIEYWTNPNNWSELRKTEKYPERLKIKSGLFKLLNKYFLLKTKNELSVLIDNKFTQMMNCNKSELIQFNY